MNLALKFKVLRMLSCFGLFGLALCLSKPVFADVAGMPKCLSIGKIKSIGASLSEHLSGPSLVEVQHKKEASKKTTRTSLQSQKVSWMDGIQFNESAVFIHFSF